MKRILKFPTDKSAGAQALSDRDRFRAAWASASQAAESMFEAKRTVNIDAYNKASDAFNRAMKVACRLVPLPPPYPRSRAPKAG